MSTQPTLILANFGGPRELDEIPAFLTSLLTDKEVIRTPLPRAIHDRLFRWIAERRAPRIAHGYALMGGKSPLYEDTEAIASQLRSGGQHDVVTFHRYLDKTHVSFFEALNTRATTPFIVFPLYPQFSYTTTGSVASFFTHHLPKSVVTRMEWVRAYGTHPLYVLSMQECIRECLESHSLTGANTMVLFSAHGLPQKFVIKGDPYVTECQASHAAIMEAFPDMPSVLAFQSKFGPGQWTAPYTSTLCRDPSSWNPNKKPVVVVPLSFTSDHFETLVEIEQEYLPALRERGITAIRCPALNLRRDWINRMHGIIGTTPRTSTDKLLR